MIFLALFIAYNPLDILFFDMTVPIEHFINYYANKLYMCYFIYCIMSYLYRLIFVSFLSWFCKYNIVCITDILGQFIGSKLIRYCI